MSFDAVLDISDPTERAILLRWLNENGGVKRINIVAERRKNSEEKEQARRLYAVYFAGYIEVFRDHLLKQGELFSRALLHESLKGRFLREPRIDQVTGESLGERVRSTTELSIPELRAYISTVQHYLFEFYGLQLPDLPAAAQPPAVRRVA